MHVSQLLCEDECSSPVRVRPPSPQATYTNSGVARPVKRGRWEALPRRPYKKFYANATPSSHCHVCARTAKAVRFAICSRLQAGLCRKVICDKCFARFGWDWDAALSDPDWVCPHCRDACPPGRSQCFIYARVNRKRETKRAARAAAAAAKAADNLASADPLQQQALGSAPQMNVYLPAQNQVDASALRSPQLAIDNLVVTQGPPPLGVLPILPPPSSLLLQSNWFQ